MDTGYEKLFRTLCKGIEALNVNLTDIAKSLRVLSDREEKKERECDRWRMAIGPEAELPGEDYDWVLVKIRDDWLKLPGSDAKIYSVPHIAEYRRDGKWWPHEWEEPYGSDEIPFEVVQWRPIPGDEVVKLYAEGEEIKWRHRYE